MCKPSKKNKLKLFYKRNKRNTKTTQKDFIDASHRPTIFFVKKDVYRQPSVMIARMFRCDFSDENVR